MKNIFLTALLVLSCINSCRCSYFAEKEGLTIIIIRHAEKSDATNNLNCKGFNRSLQIPAVFYKKFWIPNKIYVPSMAAEARTKHLRMLQTATPLAVRFDIPINSQYEENDYDHLTDALLHEKGLIILVWEHSAIPPIIHRLVPLANRLHWRGDDYDSICKVTFKRGKPTLSFDAEHINPGNNCNL